MILPLSMGDLALVRATIRSRRAVPHSFSYTAAGFPNSLPRRGAADGDFTPRAVGSDHSNERTGYGEANGLVGGAQCVRIHAQRDRTRSEQDHAA